MCCSRSGVNYLFFNIAAGSEEVEHLNFGNETSATKTKVYEIQETLGQNGYVTVTTADCIPVLENLHGKIGEGKSLTTLY